MSNFTKFISEDYKWIFFAATLFLSILLVVLFSDFWGVSNLGYTYPFSSELIRFPDVIYHLVVTPIGIYLGYVGVIKLIREKRFTTEFLMSIASLSALYIDYVFEAATVLLLFSVAEYFEDYIEDRAKRSVEGLVKYIPDVARLVKDGDVETVDADEVSPGQLILVRPGERIPLDGVVVEGFSNIDESLVTGESMPVPRKVGDEVYSGTLNLDGVLKIRVTRASNESLVSKIVELVFQARARKAKTENLVDRFVKYYVPIVILIAIFTASVPSIIFGGDFTTWLYRSLILVVVACPSAFIISVPATFFTSLTLSSRKGIIIKGGKYIEGLGKINTLLLDKTGTLTLGEPTLMLSCKDSYVDDPDALVYAALLEGYSNHPIAGAFSRWISNIESGLRGVTVSEVREYAGKGIVGRVNGSIVAVGNRDLLKKLGVKYKDGINGDGHSKVYIIRDGRVVGRLCVADRIRDDALEAIKELKKLGIKTVILTGDKKDVADDIARELGIDEYYAELKPIDKLEILRRIRKDEGYVAMVGDGINDAPALAEADVGIAMSSDGVNVTLEAADIVLVKNRLTQIPYLIKLGRMTNEVAKENIILSIGVKLLLGALGILGFIPLWMTVAVGDDGITLFLFLNILRLRSIA